jgi:3-methyladenine DNA glycosylase Tag
MTNGYEHDLYLLEKEKVKALIHIANRLDKIDDKLSKFKEYYEILVNEKTREEMRGNFRHEENET